MKDGGASLLRELVGQECRCGGVKAAHQSFCWRCWKDLPPHMQKALYQQFGKGYEQAYSAAVEYLRQAMPLSK